MEEKIIIKSEQYSVKKLFLSLIIIGSLILLIVLIWQIPYYLDHLDRVDAWRTHYEHSEYCYETKGYYWYGNDLRRVTGELDCPYRFKPDFEWFYFLVDGVVPFVSSILLAFLIKLWLSSYEMVVTDKRIYGKIAFGKRVDLPYDSISATSILRIFRGISVSTASGRIRFLLIKNASKMYEEINKLLIERQKKETPVIIPAPINTNASNNSPDDLIKLKNLLDMGIITQEEFDAKKKQILGL